MVEKGTNNFHKGTNYNHNNGSKNGDVGTNTDSAGFPIMTNTDSAGFPIMTLNCYTDLSCSDAARIHVRSQRHN